MLYIKVLFYLYTEILWAGGKAKEKEMVYICKINTHNLGKTNSYPMYIGKIHI